MNHTDSFLSNCDKHGNNQRESGEKYVLHLKEIVRYINISYISKTEKKTTEVTQYKDVIESRTVSNFSDIEI